MHSLSGRFAQVAIAVLFSPAGRPSPELLRADSVIQKVTLAFARNLAKDQAARPPGCCGPLENSIVFRAIGLFHSASRFVVGPERLPGLAPATEAVVLRYARQYLEAAIKVYGREWSWPHLSQQDSENVDTSRRVSCYIAAQVGRPRR